MEKSRIFFFDKLCCPICSFDTFSQTLNLSNNSLSYVISCDNFQITFNHNFRMPFT